MGKFIPSQALSGQVHPFPGTSRVSSSLPRHLQDKFIPSQAPPGQVHPFPGTSRTSSSLPRHLQGKFITSQAPTGQVHPFPGTSRQVHPFPGTSNFFHSLYSSIRLSVLKFVFSMRNYRRRTSAICGLFLQKKDITLNHNFPTEIFPINASNVI